MQKSREAGAGAVWWVLHPSVQTVPGRQSSSKHDQWTDHPHPARSWPAAGALGTGQGLLCQQAASLTTGAAAGSAVTSCRSYAR